MNQEDTEKLINDKEKQQTNETMTESAYQISLEKEIEFENQLKALKEEMKSIKQENKQTREEYMKAKHNELLYEKKNELLERTKKSLENQINSLQKKIEKRRSITTNTNTG